VPDNVRFALIYSKWGASDSSLSSTAMSLPKEASNLKIVIILVVLAHLNLPSWLDQESLK